MGLTTPAIRWDSAVEAFREDARTRTALQVMNEAPSVVRFIKTWEVGRAVPSDADASAMAVAYKRSSLVNACVAELSEQVAQAPLVAFRGDKPAPSGDLLRELVEHPNSETTPKSQTERIVADLGIFGRFLLVKLRSRAGIPRELWPLPVHQTETILGKDGNVERYEVAGMRKFKPEDVIDCKIYNPTNPHIGLSPLYVLSAEGSLDKNALTFLDSFFHNLGIPSMVVTAAGEITNEQRNLIEAEIEKRYGRDAIMGVTGSGKPLILSHGAKAEAFGINPGQLDMAPIFDVAESRVCAVYGVPAILVGVRVGLVQAQAYGTAREARRYWVSSKLVPFWGWLADEIMLGLAADFGKGYRLQYDTSNVLALQEAKLEIARVVTAGFYAYAVTRDEARAAMGFPPIDNEPVFRHQLLASQAQASVQGEEPIEPPGSASNKLRRLPRRLPTESEGAA